jgi:hypothetical protein
VYTESQEDIKKKHKDGKESEILCLRCNSLCFIKCQARLAFYKKNDCQQKKLYLKESLLSQKITSNYQPSLGGLGG